jgi:hypothetical protein
MPNNRLAADPHGALPSVLRIENCTCHGTTPIVSHAACVPAALGAASAAINALHHATDDLPPEHWLYTQTIALQLVIAGCTRQLDQIRAQAAAANLDPCEVPRLIFPPDYLR